MCVCAYREFFDTQDRYQVELGNKYRDRWFPYVSRSFMKVRTYSGRRKKVERITGRKKSRILGRRAAIDRDNEIAETLQL